MHRKDIVMNVDFFDEVCIRETPFGPEDVDELVRRCAEAGVDTLYWRAIGLGVAGYPSRLLQDPATLRESDMSAFMPRMFKAEQDDALPTVARSEDNDKNYVLEVSQQEGYRQSIGQWGKRIAASLREMDPIAQARQACKKHGLSFYIWHDFLDERHNLALAQHPEWLVTGKDGTTRFPGLRSYAIEAAVANQREVLRELLNYHPDGLYLSTSCHNRHLNFPEPDDFFGFEEPVVAACREKMGVDIRTESFDESQWHEIKGSFVTDFFRRIKELAKTHNAKLAIGTQVGPHTILTAPVFSTHTPYRFATQWKTWIDEGIADVLILGDYEWPWDNVPIWEAKRMSWPVGSYAADIEGNAYAEYSDNRAQLYWFSSWLSAYAAKHQGASADSLAGAMQMRAQTLKATSVHGICLHEAMTFERESDGFETIKEMRRDLDA
jgi:hypothetical protein